MKHFFHETQAEINLGYQWKHNGKWNRLEVTAATTAHSMQAGSEEAFIAEHYWGYSKYDGVTTFEYAVQHPAWEVYPVKEHCIDCDFAALYGPAFAFLEHQQPTSVFLAKGSAISVLHKRKL